MDSPDLNIGGVYREDYDNLINLTKSLKLIYKCR